MKIESTSSTGNFEIKNNDNNRLLELIYSNWFSSNAKTVFNSNNIEIKPKNIWASKFDIITNGSDKGDISFNWKGNIIIRLENKNKTDNQFLLKAIGLWKLGFELLDQKENKILFLKPNFKWTKFSYDYEVLLEDNIVPNNEIIELLIYSGFSANLYMTRMMAG
ncbi:aminotransferase [Flavivirga sp. 57AJ16]|uniref:aminotransferase n=1 Tax=Flavivirga sp. 57AJ16 TaxID=3025307 RepID=UPI002366C180|nr:aminotransferase [Flavivirga sp. 57AJ16]MDD7885483.1 aminotransferase [Flavivirga sp. 57AJ16]